jgi:hypothetical protein
VRKDYEPGALARPPLKASWSRTTPPSGRTSSRGARLRRALAGHRFQSLADMPAANFSSGTRVDAGAAMPVKA